MKQKVLLLLFWGVVNIVNSQHNNKSLKVTFDSEAFEIKAPYSWKEIESTYPYYWVKEYRHKDTAFNSYFRVAQYIISDTQKNTLDRIVKKRIKNLKKIRYRKFNYSITKINDRNHLVLKTSWRNWRNRKSILKHTTEFVKQGNELYVFNYSDSTFSSKLFKDNIKRIMFSFSIKREIKDIQVKKEISEDQLKNYFKNYSIVIPKRWYGFIGETDQLEFAPRKFYSGKYTRNRNVFFVRDYTGKDSYGETVEKFFTERYKKINSEYRKYNTVVKEVIHNRYGKYFLIKYSSRVEVKKENYKGSTEATVIEALIVNGQKKYILTYSFENNSFKNYFNDALNMINSFEIK